MKDEYDFTNAGRGKFYKDNAEFNEYECELDELKCKLSDMRDLLA
jgi:hypothetical protein